jgi:hypothetical protein
MAPWQRISSTTVSRPIGENEMFLKLYEESGAPINRGAWSLSATATLEGKGAASDLLPGKVRRAWGHLRFQHPNIAAIVAEDKENLIYTIPEASTLDSWYDDTFKLVDNIRPAGTTTKTLPAQKPGSYMDLTYATQTREVQLYTMHWRTDGRGILLLLNDLLKLVAQDDLDDPQLLAWGEEVSRLAPPIEEVLGCPPDPNETQKKIAEECVGSFGRFAGAVGIPFIEDAGAPGATARYNLTFDKTFTEAVVKACKTRDITVTSAIHASLATANWRFSTEDRKLAHYTSCARWSLRPWIPAPFNTSAHAAALCTTGWMERVEQTNDWPGLARHYTSIYRRGLSSDFLHAHQMYASGLVQMMQNLPEGQPPQSEVDISSIGVVDQVLQPHYGSDEEGIELKAISVGLDMLTPQSMLFVWTFRGQLSLELCYNEAFHTRKQMDEFVLALRSILVHELQIVD